MRTTKALKNWYHLYKVFYSRRINVQHRVVYKVDDEKKEIVIYSAWGHYE